MLDIHFFTCLPFFISCEVIGNYSVKYIVPAQLCYAKPIISFWVFWTVGNLQSWVLCLGSDLAYLFCLCFTIMASADTFLFQACQQVYEQQQQMHHPYVIDLHLFYTTVR